MTRMGRILSFLIIVAAVAAAAACSGQSSGQPGAPAAGAAPAASKPPVAVTTAPVAFGAFQNSIEVVGTLAPKFSAEVKSEVTATVTDVFVTEWVPVRKGDRLARFDTSEMEATIAALRAGEAQARVGESRAKREYERAQQLKEFGLITPQAFDDAKSAVEAAEASTSAAQAQIKTAQARLAKSMLFAPMDGIVAFRGVNVGDRVENMGGNTPLFRIVDNRLLDLTVSVPSTRLADVKVGQAIEFAADALPGRTFTGKVMFINPEIDEASRSARVVAEVVNRDSALKGGMFAKGRIVVTNRDGVLQVPREALLNWSLEQKTADVFVVKGDVAEKRPVKTGASSDGIIEILSGVQAGEQVVTRGGFAIRAGDRVAASKGEGA
ncbi:MAG: efflux RND transporter periplasmic adaptor subunit [Acidobacteria bacterium]|nr:efflux RND transporter periplasmic adaptor subunit [Acidobacteriota bacterium]